MAEEKDDEMKKEEFEKEQWKRNKDEYHDEFHKKYISKKHILRNDIIIHAGYGGGSSFCKKSISSGLYQYKFKIRNITGGMMIGIWKIQKNKTPPTDTGFTKGKYQGYGYDVYNGQLSNPESGYNDKQYGISCKNKPEAKTIIRMNINMNKYELSYTINDTDYGIAFKIEKAEYKVAVYIGWGGDSIEILQKQKTEFKKSKIDRPFANIFRNKKRILNYQSPPQQDNEMKKEEFEPEISQKNKNEFHKKYISKKHILKNNIITAVDSDVLDGSGSSFCKKSISSGLYQYKFKIGNIDDSIIIGIWKIQKNKTPPTVTCFTKGKYQGYGFNVYTGKLTIPYTGVSGKRYGLHSVTSLKVKPGTIIRMNINMNKCELSYTINDTDCGIAFEIERAEYVVAVYIKWKGDSIELL